VSEKQSATRNEQARRVREMFATIASRYDLLNHLLSGNIDKRWRRLVAEVLRPILAQPDAAVLDVACGTGDLALTLSRGSAARVFAIDFCRPMLDIATTKVAKAQASLPLIEGDALELPFADESFDAVTIAFGLRNLASFAAGFSELLRILRPGGRLVVLEFSQPRGWLLRSIFKVYFTRVLPLLGGLVSGSRSAYQYLPASVARFPDQEELVALMQQVGFVEVTFQNLTGGIAALHCGRRPVR
jgi:demethylmenaquinone methyltransferase / 2-methoxy-6-polyprenyl-1,4-benzoquinol methylase